MRLLHITNNFSGSGRSSFRARRLVEHFRERGWEVLTRHAFVDDRDAVVRANPGVETDVIDAEEFDAITPDAITVEEGLLLPGTSHWRVPPELCVDFVEEGGVVLVMDCEVNTFLRWPPGDELAFFGATVDSTRGVPYLRDETEHPGLGPNLRLRPEAMTVDGWLRPALAGVDHIEVAAAVPVLPTGGDIAATSHATARALAMDKFVDVAIPAPIATVRQHRLGYAGVITAHVSPDELTAQAPGNLTWIAQLVELLVSETTRNRRIAGKAPRPDDTPSTEDLIANDEGDRLEFKETARFDVRENQRNKAMEREVAQAVAELWNAHGGVLLIGVSDSPREVTGLQRDYLTFSNQDQDLRDQFLRWLAQLLANELTPQLSTRVRIRIDDVGGVDIARIDVPAGDTPMWLDKTTLRVRRGNTGVTLDARATHEYIAKRFPSR